MQQDRDSARDLWFLDTLVRIHVAHEEGMDGVSIVEHWAPLGESPPLHVHLREDESFYVLEGELRFVTDREERRAGPGETVFTRQGIAHTYRVESPGGGHWLVITTRGDFEKFVRELSRLASAPELPGEAGPPSEDELAALREAAERNHIRIVGPPLT